MSDLQLNATLLYGLPAFFTRHWCCWMHSKFQMWFSKRLPGLHNYSYKDFTSSKLPQSWIILGKGLIWLGVIKFCLALLKYQLMTSFSSVLLRKRVVIILSFLGGGATFVLDQIYLVRVSSVCGICYFVIQTNSLVGFKCLIAKVDFTEFLRVSFMSSWINS